MARAHVGAVAHAEEQGAAGAVFVFVHFAGRMHDEGAGRDGYGFHRRAHGAAAGKAEVDLGGVRVAVIGADLPGLPAGHCDVAVGDRAEDLLDVLLGIPFLFLLEAEDVHGHGAPADMSGEPSARGRAGEGEIALRPGIDRRVAVGPVAQWLEPTAHNGLVGGSKSSRAHHAPRP